MVTDTDILAFAHKEEMGEETHWCTSRPKKKNGFKNPNPSMHPHITPYYSRSFPPKPISFPINFPPKPLTISPYFPRNCCWEQWNHVAEKKEGQHLCWREWHISWPKQQGNLTSFPKMLSLWCGPNNVIAVWCLFWVKYAIEKVLVCMLIGLK